MEALRWVESGASVLEIGRISFDSTNTIVKTTKPTYPPARRRSLNELTHASNRTQSHERRCKETSSDPSLKAGTIAFDDHVHQREDECLLPSLDRYHSSDASPHLPVRKIFFPE